MDLQNSTVLITGGTSGIGLELVKQLSGQGSKILVTGRNHDALEATKRRFPNVHVYQSDVSDPKNIEQLYQDITKQYPDLNIIINNAGLMRLLDLQDATKPLEDITREISTNLSGTIQMVHQFLPHLMKKRSAAIVNVSSGIAYVPYCVAPVYSASKAGVHAYTQALRLQLKDTNVKVFEMIPPGVKTNLQKDWILPPNASMMMEVEKMVKIAIDGLRKDKPELRPFLIGVVKMASRMMPDQLIKLGTKEFRKLKQMPRQKV